MRARASVADPMGSSFGDSIDCALGMARHGRGGPLGNRWSTKWVLPRSLLLIKCPGTFSDTLENLAARLSYLQSQKRRLLQRESTSERQTVSKTTFVHKRHFAKGNL